MTALPLAYKQDGVQLHFKHVSWDSKAFNRACYELTIESSQAAEFDASKVCRFMRDHRMETVTFRGAGHDPWQMLLMRELNFHYVDLHMELQTRLAEREVSPSLPGTLRMVESERDREAVLDMAADSFLYTRFRIIPGVTRESIRQRYQNWASRLISQHPKLAVVLEMGGNFVGFFLAEPSSKPGEILLQLAGNNPNLTIRSGYVLYTLALAWYREAGFNRAKIETEARNLDSLNLWHSLGMRFVDARAIYLWNDCWDTPSELTNKLQTERNGCSFPVPAAYC